MRALRQRILNYLSTRSTITSHRASQPRVHVKHSTRPQRTIHSHRQQIPLTSPSYHRDHHGFAALAETGYQENVIVYRCVTVIARALAAVPLLLYQRDANTSAAPGQRHEHECDHHPILDLLHAPSPLQAGSTFLEQVVSYLLLAGNSYIHAMCDTKGVPHTLCPIRPDRVEILLGEGINALPQTVGYRVRRAEGGAVHLPSSQDYAVDPLTQRCEILHIKLFNPLNDWYGQSPMMAATTAIAQHHAVAKHNLALLDNGARPSGAFVLKGQELGLSQTQREELQQELRSLHSGHDNAGRVLFLEGDFDWHELSLSPKDLDFVAGKNVSAREICQAFGVPPMLAGVPGDATFANYREARFHLWEDTILPLLALVVAELNMWLIPYFGAHYRLGYDLDRIPALAPKREQAWAKVADAAFLTLNEKRHAVGYSPVAGGDELLFVSQ